MTIEMFRGTEYQPQFAEDELLLTESTEERLGRERLELQWQLGVMSVMLCIVSSEHNELISRIIAKNAEIRSVEGFQEAPLVADLQPPSNPTNGEQFEKLNALVRKVLSEGLDMPLSSGENARR